MFVAACGFSLVAVSGGYSINFGMRDSHCIGFSCWRTQALAVGSIVVAHRFQSMGSAVVAHRLSCPSTCGISPDKRLNPCPLHWHYHWTTREAQVSIILRRLKSYQAFFMTTTVWNYKAITRRKLEKNTNEETKQHATKQPMGHWKTKEEMKKFLKTCEHGNTTFQNPWDAAKAVLRSS